MCVYTTLKDYVQTYLKEEIQAEALVRNLGGFARSLPVMALYNGQMINTAGMARDAEVERKTAEGYIQILEDTLLAKRLDPYQAKITVREKKRPKIYWVDPGLVRAAKGLSGSVSPEERGSLFEAYVFQMIRHEIENTRQYDQVYYWAPAESKVEVDFLIRRASDFVAVEVKSAKIIRAENLRGLRAISSMKTVKRKILVYLGEETQRTADDIDILPLMAFNRQLSNGLLDTTTRMD